MADARILDRGYRHFEGRRLGVGAAAATLGVHTLRRVLGLRRPFRAKVAPLVVVGMAYLPAIVFLGVAGLLPRQLTSAVLPGPDVFYRFITSAMLLFVTLAGPETLCADRRHRTLGLYLASPLTRTSYLAAKAGALLVVLLVVTLGPPLLTQVGYALLGVGSADAGAVAGVLGRIVAAGLLLSLLYTAFGLAGASLTDRRAFASAVIFLGLILLGVASGIAVQGLGGPRWLLLLNVAQVPVELVLRMYGARGALRAVGTPALIAGYASWTLGLAGAVLARYRGLEVNR